MIRWHAVLDRQRLYTLDITADVHGDVRRRLHLSLSHNI